MDADAGGGEPLQSVLAKQARGGGAYRQAPAENGAVPALEKVACAVGLFVRSHDGRMDLKKALEKDGQATTSVSSCLPQASTFKRVLATSWKARRIAAF